MNDFKESLAGDISGVFCIYLFRSMFFYKFSTHVHY